MAKRGRKPSKGKKSYFGEEEENAVVEYISTDDKNKKDEIYNLLLKPAFTKMVSSIIRTYKLFVPGEEYEETFSDTLSFMLTKLSCFNPDKGTKAYSYCGTICKNYLIYRNVQHEKNKKRYETYEDINETLSPDLVYSPDDSDFKIQAPSLITKVTSEISNMLSNSEVFDLTEGEKKVGSALIDLFKSWEDVIEDDGSNKLNKSSVLYFLREQTLMSTKELRDNMKKYKSVYLYIKKAMEKSM